MVELNPLLGKYYGEELHTHYHIFQKGDTINLNLAQKAQYPIFPHPLPTRMLWIGFGELKFDYSSDDEVKGIHIGGQRVSGAYFRKLAQN